jgi:hypothetical protein
VTTVFDVLVALAITLPLSAAAAALAYAHFYAQRRKLSDVLGELAETQRTVGELTGGLAALRRDVDKMIERRM